MDFDDAILSSRFGASDFESEEFGHSDFGVSSLSSIVRVLRISVQFSVSILLIRLFLRSVRFGCSFSFSNVGTTFLVVGKCVVESFWMLVFFLFSLVCPFVCVVSSLLSYTLISFVRCRFRSFAPILIVIRCHSHSHLSCRTDSIGISFRFKFVIREISCTEILFLHLLCLSSHIDCFVRLRH